MTEADAGSRILALYEGELIALSRQIAILDNERRHEGVSNPRRWRIEGELRRCRNLIAAVPEKARKLKQTIASG